MKRSGRNTSLAPRALDILIAIVRLNIETGRAVSSGLVERSVKRQMSSATIRAIMKNLEQAGYLTQPHTSAGRLPTDAGFRAFVDRLLAGWAFQRHETPPGLRRLADQGLRQGIDSANRLKSLARLLSRLTDNISIIVGPTMDDVRAVRVELYPRSQRRVLMVLVLENAEAKTRLVDLPTDTPAAVVAEAAKLLTERIQGKTVRQINAVALETVDLVGTPVSRCAAALARRGGEIFRDATEVEIEFEGVGNILEEPEFDDTEPLKALLRFMESPNRIRKTLDRLEPLSPHGFKVWIGRENPVGELRRFSLLTGRYDLGGRPGLLAVLGPRRMSYQRAFHGMEILRRAIVEVPGPLAS
jgi:heat-inducible transcriptional repressor